MALTAKQAQTYRQGSGVVVEQGETFGLPGF